MSANYQKPNRVALIGNTAIRWLAEVGISLGGTRVLRVRGRKSGQQRAVVVNLLTVDNRHYVVSPRGNTEWARNVSAAGVVEVGSRWRRQRREISEVADDGKPEILRRYLARWYWQVKGYVSVTPQSGDDELRAAAESIPVFALALQTGPKPGQTSAG